MATKFTKEQQEILRANPYTLKVNDIQIKFTVDFKRYLLAEIAKPGVTYRAAFQKAGYDPEILGKQRMNGAVKYAREQANSPQGLHQTAPTLKDIQTKDLSKKQTEKAIKELRDEVTLLRQQIAFLKKTLQLSENDESQP